MQTPTRSKTNGRMQNHTPTLARPTGMKVKTHVKAGLFPPGPS
jgi:hypothetical protein